MSDIRSKIEKKARSAIVQYAFFRLESAIILGGTILLMFFLPKPFPWWPIWGWLALGGLGLFAVVISSLSDADTNAKVLLTLFQEQFDPHEIQDTTLRRDVETALEYQRRIEAHTRRQRPGVLRDRLERTAAQLADWIGNIYKLAARLDAYRHDPLLAQERETAPRELESLLQRREMERNREVQARLDEVIESKRKQWQALQALDTRMEQAELQMEQSLTALATIYSQVQLVNAQDIESGRSEHLREDIREQVERLNDLVASISEVYNYDGIET